MDSIKELVKQHFNLVEAPATEDSTEMMEVDFATIKTKDGELTMKYDELEAGKPVFVVDEEGNEIPTPTGEYVLDNDVVVRVEDGIIASIKTERTEEDEVKDEEMSKEVETESTEVAMEETVDETVEVETEEEEDDTEKIIEAIATAVEAKLQGLIERMDAVEGKVAQMSVEPAVEPSVIKSNKSNETFKTKQAKLVFEAIKNRK